KTNGSTRGLAVIIVVFARRAVDIEARRDAPAEEVWLGERQRIIARAVKPAARRNLYILPAAEKVALRHRTFDADALASCRRAPGRIAGADREFASRLLHHIDHEDNLIRLGARSSGNIDRGKEFKIL